MVKVPLEVVMGTLKVAGVGAFQTEAQEGARSAQAIRKASSGVGRARAGRERQRTRRSEAIEKR